MQDAIDPMEIPGHGRFAIYISGRHPGWALATAHRLAVGYTLAMSPLAILGVMLIQVLFVLVPFAIAALIVERITRGRPVEHVTCGRCLYNVEFAPSSRCQECGSELLKVGLLHPKMPGGRLRKVRAYIGLFALISLPPALVLGVIVAEHLEDLAHARAMAKAGGPYEPVTKTINAIGPASGEYRQLAALVHYRIGPGPFHHYETLSIEVQLNDGTEPYMTIPLRNRTIEWTRGEVILPPEIDAGNEQPQPRVLAEADLDREVILAWLGRQGIDVARDAVRDEVNDFIDYIIANMTTETSIRGVPAPPGLDAFQNVTIPIDVTVPGAGAGRVPGPIVAVLAFALLLLIPLWQLRRTNAQRRRAACAWTSTAHQATS